ncbi:histidine--tRNA ligase [Asticcacaulis sp. ZE23SCel15]|uniref:histidine--tRNA ligase n=1 Tax=Asticcacaulis sp. ZE23SCel15 TaxID=3059027 RepID=UPI002660324E|nr:histidine--tRNA ligase [Asticcacaulis sp. ZE23SCel15]WKL58799.1 histidine--tRNA ligase [Asticcacaulis sp. ZE23SCel15]
MTDKAPKSTETDPKDFRPEARAPRGFADKRASQIAAERRLITAVSKVYEDFGFEALQTSAFEYADALGKFLPDADRPNVGVFAVEDDDEQWMALRYDHTAPLARFAAQNWDSLPKPFRRYAFGPVWRNEKPGPGRLREFMQCDADTVGTDRPEADAEIIALAVAGFKAAGLPASSTVLKVNNRKLLNGLLTSLGVVDSAQQMGVLRAIDKLDRLGLTGVELLLGGGRKDELGDFTKGANLKDDAIFAVMNFVAAGINLDGEQASRDEVLARLSSVLRNSSEGMSGVEDLSRIGATLNGLGVSEADAIFDPSIVRGLEYYTGAVFEAELLLETRDEKGELVKFGSVGGGGRYDDLVARFTGERVPATGFSFGVSRLAAALALTEGGKATPVRGPVVIIAFSDSDMGEYFKLASEIRAAGIPAEVYLGRSGMKAQMKYADRRLSPAVAMIGGDELANGTVTIKDLDLGREMAAEISDNKAWREGRPGQVTLPRQDAINHLKTIVKSL